MTACYYTVNANRYENTDQGFAAAHAAATRDRARLLKHWTGPFGPCQDDESADYPVLRETDTHLWVDSPIGKVGIPAIRRSQGFGNRPATAPGAAAVSVRLRVSEFAGQPGLQCSWVTYADGAGSDFSGVCLTAEQLSREE